MNETVCNVNMTLNDLVNVTDPDIYAECMTYLYERL